MACEELNRGSKAGSSQGWPMGSRRPNEKGDGCCSDQAGVQPDEVTYYAVISALTSDRGPVCVCVCVCTSSAAQQNFRRLRLGHRIRITA